MTFLKEVLMSSFARTRAEVDIRTSANAGTDIVERFPTDCLVEILEEKDDWCKIKPVRLMYTASGYVPRRGLVFPPPVQPLVFPILLSPDGKELGDSVPGSLKLADFQHWQAEAVGGKPGWIASDVWEGLGAEKQPVLLDGILASIRADQPGWDNWVQDVTACSRTEQALMEEWTVRVQGGRELYAIRDHYIYEKPSTDSKYFGCALKGQIMRWTGKIRSNIDNGISRTFYEVAFYRMSRAMQGWFRADLLAEYIFPTDENDSQTDSNAQTVFDLSVSILRHPQDQQIADAKKMGYTGAQYIDVFEATGTHLRHFSLCGEFCVATLASRDMIPTLSAWIASNYWRVSTIMKDPHEGTGLGDLQSLLKVVGLQGELYSSVPTTPQHIKARLAQGQFPISGCGINSVGKVKADGKIRHWVVVEDILPVGNSGWVRIYNPFNNQEEVYNYDLFMASAGTGAGLWVTPLPPPANG
jgi:hypothetical protein